ncbi:MaoC family dehydratase N-terminal domain-containing protein [bacterium]|nr:MaoC family dehydratase N-terminal domain-containing protein [bacterium]
MVEKTKLAVGDTFEATQSVGKYQAIYYGGASGDFNPIHIDDEFARMVGLGGAILQGLCTMAFAASAHIDAAGGDPRALKKIKVRFSRPVRIGDDVTTRARVESVRGGEAVTSFVCVTPDGAEVIKNASATLKA